MRIGLQSWGTEGDFRPFLALAEALVRRGHDVRFAFTGVEGRDLSSQARNAGVDVRFVDAGYFVANREELARRARESFVTGSPLTQFEAILRELMDPVAAPMQEAARELAASCDVIVGHLLAHSAAAAAEERGVPYVTLALQPVFASHEYAPAGVPRLGRLFNPLAWKLADFVMNRALLPRVNASRAACGLPASARVRMATLGAPTAVLVAVSPALFPRPRDWSPHLDVCGFLSPSEATEPWQVEPRVEAFLDEAPPVYLSFGSMFSVDDHQAAESVAVFAEAVELARARGIIQAPPAVIAGAPKHARVCYIERAPHARLFPRCAAVVHHGGAGTTQSALLAGRPSVVVPHAADQFYWGDVLHARGAGAAPLKRPALSAKALAKRIRAVLDEPAYAARAQELSRALQTERGIDRAVERITACADGRRPTAR